MRDIADLQERIKQGNQAIQKARNESNDTTGWLNHLNQLNAHLSELLAQIPEMKLSEFEKGDYSIEVYSTLLEQSVWFCPAHRTVDQKRREDSEVICYTADELRHLIALNPGPESLKTIHAGKSILNGSIISSEAKP